MCAKKILVVDDEQPLVELLTANLEREGYEVISAGDGLTAIELAEHQKPDLILLDWMLPKLDGFEVCKRLRPKTTAPIIMVTAKGEEIDKILGLEIGADDYITKPKKLPEQRISSRSVNWRSIRARIRSAVPVSTSHLHSANSSWCFSWRKMQVRYSPVKLCFSMCGDTSISEMCVLSM